MCAHRTALNVFGNIGRCYYTSDRSLNNFVTFRGLSTRGQIGISSVITVSYGGREEDPFMVASLASVCRNSVVKVDSCLSCGHNSSPFQDSISITLCGYMYVILDVIYV